MKTTTEFDRIMKAVKYLRRRLKRFDLQPTISMTLGSGLGGQFTRILKNAVKIPYSEIPGFPVPKVDGHAGVLWIGMIGDKCVAVMQGRVHFYEGYTPDEVVFATRVLAKLGCKVQIITNAVGGIAPRIRQGDLVLIEDHIDLGALSNVLIGPNEPRFGTRFTDMIDAYDPSLRQLARRCAHTLQITLRPAVHSALTGPSYETPATIRALRRLGADTVGMGTILEVQALRHMGQRVLAIAVCTNKAAGCGGKKQKLNHVEVKLAAARAESHFTMLLVRIIGTMPS